MLGITLTAVDRAQLHLFLAAASYAIEANAFDATGAHVYEAVDGSSPVTARFTAEEWSGLQNRSVAFGLTVAGASYQE